MKIEILAPAGNRESLIAGVRSGANAVYLGGKRFNARRSAGNFDDDELKSAVEYCRQRGVKVYLALNILLSDYELYDAYNEVKHALEAGVDAFIVQDIGTAKMIREHFGQARLHASTQMTVISPAGAKFAKELGFSRLVLPREMTREEIREMRESTDLELEMFVNGALCMSVSGQCRLSSVIGGRSGNRGMCAQPCRLPFTAGGGQKYALSLRDLSLIRHIKELDGITSLKIEGRMKRPEYVSAAVTAVRRALDGEDDAHGEELLRCVFSRSGFTDGYFTDSMGRQMFGTRQREDVIAAPEAIKEIRHNYDNENPLVPVDMSFECHSSKPSSLTASALGRTVKIVGDVPEPALKKPMTQESVAARISKLGGTPYYAQSVDVSLDDGLVLSASEINGMRREAVEKLGELHVPEVICKPFDVVAPRRKDKKPYACAVFSGASQVPDSHPFERIFIPLFSPPEAFAEKRAGAVIPHGAFGCTDKISRRLSQLKAAGVQNILCPDVGAYTLARDMGFNVFGDYTMNIFNSVSANMIKSPVLSFELMLAQANAVNAADTGLAAYGRMMLMLTRNCPVKNDIGCEACAGHGKITDRTGTEFPVMCGGSPCSQVLNSVPLYMLDRQEEIKTDFIQLYFTTESRAEVEKIIQLYESGEKPGFKYTRGLYQRGVI